MKLPILAYGHSILKQQCNDIEKSYPGLDQLISDMWKTMYHANGCGLAAPQIGHPIKLFIVNSKTTFESLEATDRENYFDKKDNGITETFINARITKRSAETWEDEEGCLSIPGLTQKVKRHLTITIAYANANFEQQIRTFSGTTARMIQHEYDHTEGILYLDHLKPLTKKLMEGKLKKIARGKVRVKYPIKYFGK